MKRTALHPQVHILPTNYDQTRLEYDLADDGDLTVVLIS
jgi:hypothetical protein